MGMAKLSFFGLVSLNLGWNWTKKKVFASWAVVRNFRIIAALVIFLAVFNFAVYLMRQNAAFVENRKRDSVDNSDFQNPKIIHEFVEPTVIAKTIRNPCPPHLLSSDSHLPVVYMITPTYQRWTQKADLTRLCYTVMQVPQLHWIVVEDSEEKTVLVEKMLSGQYSCKPSIVTHLNIKSPTKVPNITPFLKRWGRNSLPHRGVVQRNLALRWLREAAVWDQLQGNGSGVVYFGDDDNVYDLRVFEEMRSTHKVSVWPVGLSGGLKYEGPICENGKVVDWYAMWDRDRTFMIDMAGFAINLKALVSTPEASFDLLALKGRLEESILLPLTTPEQLEPKADMCKAILVWHVRTAKPKMTHEEYLIRKGAPSDPDIEV